MAQRYRRPVRLYTDVIKGMYWLVVFMDAKNRVEVPVTVAALKNAKRGYPWECWLAQAIMKYIQENPSAFSEAITKIANEHKTFVYVIRSTIYIIDRYKNGQPSHALRYFHDFGPLTRKFDRLSKVQFLELIGDKDLILMLRPAKYGGHREPDIGRRPSRNKKRPKDAGGTQIVSHGALGRAQEAGLVPLSARSVS